MFWARFGVFGSKATSWHGEFIHANEACTLTSLPSAYGTHTGPLFSPLCRIGVSIIELSGEQLSLGDPGDQTKTEEKKENVDPGKSHRVNPTWNTGLANLKEVGFFQWFRWLKKSFYWNDYFMVICCVSKDIWIQIISPLPAYQNSQLLDTLTHRRRKKKNPLLQRKSYSFWKLTFLSQTSYTYLQENQSLFVELALILSLAHKGCTFKLAFTPLTTMQIGER